MKQLCKKTRNLDIEFGAGLYQDVSLTYKFSDDQIYNDKWKIVNSVKAKRIGSDDCSRILLTPGIHIGSIAWLRIRRGDSNQGWYVGVTKLKVDHTKSSWLGKLDQDWSMAWGGKKCNNGIYEKFHDVVSDGDIVEIVVDRALGTVGFYEQGVYK